MADDVAKVTILARLVHGLATMGASPSELVTISGSSDVVLEAALAFDLLDGDDERAASWADVIASRDEVVHALRDALVLHRT